MKIVHDYPPNYERIIEYFDVAGIPTVIFAYGDTIYSPLEQNLPDHILIHEETHERQQAEIGPEAWWDRYLTDARFRLEQELEAYRTQYNFVRERYNRAFSRRVLKQIIKDLSGRMYGYLVTEEHAKELIR